MIWTKVKNSKFCSSYTLSMLSPQLKGGEIHSLDTPHIMKLEYSAIKIQNQTSIRSRTACFYPTIPNLIKKKLKKCNYSTPSLIYGLELQK